MIAPGRVSLRAWHLLSKFWQDNFQEQRCAVCHIPFSAALLNSPGTVLQPAPLSPPGLLPDVPPPDVLPDMPPNMPPNMPPGLPQAFLHSNAPLQAALGTLCPACQKQMLPRLAGYCPHCGEIAAVGTAPLSPCSTCLSKAPPWNQFHFHGVHELALRQILHRAKFAGESAAQALLGLLLCATWQRFAQSNVWPDLLVPMPLHPIRLRHRGFNQCMEIARPLHKVLNVPLAPLALKRMVHTTPQTGLSRQARTHNTQMFAPTPLVRGKNIVLIDDIMTTGTTLRQASTALLQGGATHVHILVLARASLYHQVEVEY